jgi:hypothetical protein
MGADPAVNTIGTTALAVIFTLQFQLQVMLSL